MKTAAGLLLGLILISSVFAGNASAFVKFQALATASLEDCASAERRYGRAVGTINGHFELVFGKKEVSQRIADRATGGGMVTDIIIGINELSAFLVDKCYYTEKSLEKVHGTLNQNIIDSLKIYKGMSIKDIKTSQAKQTTSKNEVKKTDTKKKTEVKKKTETKVKSSVKKDAKSNTPNTKPAKKASLKDCGVWEQSYKINRDTANSAVELVYGKDEVSARVADFATSGGDVSNSIGKVNEVTANLAQNCGYTEELVPKVLGGGINQNIIDSIEIYKGMSIRAIR